MSAIEPLKVTLELPESELLDHDAGLQVRCQKCRTWSPIADYYSEGTDGLLPLVGNARCQHASGCDWEETVRVVATPKIEPEGGSLAFNVADDVKSKEKMG